MLKALVEIKKCRRIHRPVLSRKRAMEKNEVLSPFPVYGRRPGLGRGVKISEWDVSTNSLFSPGLDRSYGQNPLPRMRFWHRHEQFHCIFFGAFSTTQSYVLFLIPVQGLEEVVRLKIRPIIIKHIKISVHRLNRQKPAQPSSPSPADDQINPGDLC